MRPRRITVPDCAETEHASIRLLAGPLLTIGPKRNSEALIRGFRSVALPAVSDWLPLSHLFDQKQKSPSANMRSARWLSLRGSRSSHSQSEAAATSGRNSETEPR